MKTNPGGTGIYKLSKVEWRIRASQGSNVRVAAVNSPHHCPKLEAHSTVGDTGRCSMLLDAVVDLPKPQRLFVVVLALGIALWGTVWSMWSEYNTHLASLSTLNVPPVSREEQRAMSNLGRRSLR